MSPVIALGPLWCLCLGLCISKKLYYFSEEAGGEPAAKKLKVDDSLDGGMRDIAKAKVTEVRVSPADCVTFSITI